MHRMLTNLNSLIWPALFSSTSDILQPLNHVSSMLIYPCSQTTWSKKIINVLLVYKSHVRGSEGNFQHPSFLPLVSCFGAEMNKRRSLNLLRGFKRVSSIPEVCTR